MATNYPGSLDTGTQQPSPSASTEMDDAGFEHDAVHTNHSEAIIALETKVGTGSSSAVADSVLAGTGSGTSAWTTGTLANDISGNAATATALETARTIGGVSFNGTANINLPGVNTAGNQNTSGNAATATLAADSSLLGGLSLKSETGTPGANSVIRSASNGYTYLGWLNTTSGSTTSTISRIYASNDQFVRYVTPATFRSQVTDPHYLPLSGGTMTGELQLNARLDVGNGSNSDHEIRIYKADNNVSDHIQFYNGTTRIGEIGCEDTTWLRINQETAKNIYTPRLLRADGGFQAGNGSAATPAYSFQGDSNTGFYITGNSGVIYWSGNNNTGGYLWNSGIRTDNGTASTPAYSFTGDTDSGMIRYTTNQLALIGGGVACLIAAAGTVNTAGLATSTTSGYRYVMRNSTFGTLYHYTSSADVKENITNVTASDAATWIDALQPVTFNERWLQDGTESDEDRAFREADIQVGFIADDVLANSTTAQFAQVEDVDGTLKGVGWKWECVIAAAVAEIKSLRTRVADLEAA